MKHKDVLELRRRLKKDEITISQMSGCYVNSEKNIVTSYRETFLNLEESELFKYMELAKKTISGKLGNNLVELGFRKDGGQERQTQLMRLKTSHLKDDEQLMDFYQLVMDNFQYTGNYLILLFSDAYDVMKRTTDNQKLDESEETYEYIICAICPVALSSPGLHYEPEEQRMKAHQRDWMVGPPIHGFLFPAFSERSADVNHAMYYTKNPKEPNREFMESVLGCEPLRTTAEHREVLEILLREAVGFEDEAAEKVMVNFQESLQTIVQEQEEFSEVEFDEPLLLTSEKIQDILAESVSEEVLVKVDQVYGNYFEDDLPQADRILDPKIIKKGEQMKKEQALTKQVENLMIKLEEVQSKPQVTDEDEDIDSAEADGEQGNSKKEYDISLQVKPEKVSQIKAQVIDGKKCIVIPVDDNEEATVNGEVGLL
ncbi:MAG: DUF4317 family protein [Clostridium sp.]|jgi:hypothetical protein|nr:DUF4317 family protein [Clostridium sp.]